MTARQRATDGLLWSFAHTPATFCLLAGWVGGWALIARLLGRKIQ